MVKICPTITAFSEDEYADQMYAVTGFAKHLHIDMMDGEFAPTKSPGLDEIWWPSTVTVDIHLMYQRPMEHIDKLIKLRPNMVIIHNEATVHHMHFAAELHRNDIKVGLALLADTPVSYAEQIMHSFDQVLIFSGDLGHHGGHANMDVLHKVSEIRDHHPDVEIAWDGGINVHNIKRLADGGIQVLNVGGAIQKSHEPKNSYDTLLALAENQK